MKQFEVFQQSSQRSIARLISNANEPGDERDLHEAARMSELASSPCPPTLKVFDIHSNDLAYTAGLHRCDTWVHILTPVQLAWVLGYDGMGVWHLAYARGLQVGDGRVQKLEAELSSLKEQLATSNADPGRGQGGHSQNQGAGADSLDQQFRDLTGKVANLEELQMLTNRRADKQLDTIKGLQGTVEEQLGTIEELQDKLVAAAAAGPSEALRTELQAARTAVKKYRGLNKRLGLSLQDISATSDQLAANLVGASKFTSAIRVGAPAAPEAEAPPAQQGSVFDRLVPVPSELDGKPSKRSRGR